MKTTRTLAAIAFAAAAFVSNANAGIFDVTPKVYGAPAAAAAAERVVDINTNTRDVKVVNGETITFNIEGKQFTWKFDLFTPEGGVLNLSFILPKDLHADGVKVHVAENPEFREMYRN
jgi:hypothetical protein